MTLKTRMALECLPSGLGGLGLAGLECTIIVATATKSAGLAGIITKSRAFNITINSVPQSLTRSNCLLLRLDRLAVWQGEGLVRFIQLSSTFWQISAQECTLCLIISSFEVFPVLPSSTPLSFPHSMLPQKEQTHSPPDTHLHQDPPPRSEMTYDKAGDCSSSKLRLPHPLSISALRRTSYTSMVHENSAI